MKKGLLGILAVGLMTTAANAAELSLRFAGGGTTRDMAPGDTATVEVVLHMNRLQDFISSSSFSFVTGIDARFDVGSLVPGAAQLDPPAGSRPGWRQEYVQDSGSSKFSVTSIGSPISGWNTAASDPLGGAFNRSFFFSVTDPAGLSGVAAQPSGNVETVIMTFDITKGDFVEGDTYVVFRVEDPLPALSAGPSGWSARWQFASQLAPNQWLMNNGAAGAAFATRSGNPGDSDPRWPTRRGEEILSPLIIHNVPEPGSLALLAFGAFAALRRRR